MPPLGLLRISRIELLAAGQELVEDAVLGGLDGPGADFVGCLLTFEHDSPLDEITDDAVHVTPDVAHFGKFGGLDLDERSVDQLCEPPGDFCLAHARGADHEDVLRVDILAQVVRQL